MLLFSLVIFKGYQLQILMTSFRQHLPLKLQEFLIFREPFREATIHRKVRQIYSVKISTCFLQWYYQQMINIWWLVSDCAFNLNNVFHPAHPFNN